MSVMISKAQWENEGTLINYLARQLIKGRLGLLLGAGISEFYGLPRWSDLISALLKLHGEPPLAAGDDLIQKAGYVRAKHYGDDTLRFKRDLKTILYGGRTLDFARIRESDTLAAIGSLVMSSRRGSAAKVFTLNYDDLLENYLEYHGFTTTAVWCGKHWAHSQDVVVYHPHGYLPLDKLDESDDVILGSKEYFDIIKSPLWRPLLETALRTHTFLYIGLSGTDMHLQSLIADLNSHHAIADERVCYHGVRFAETGSRDEVGTILDRQGVFTHRLSSYESDLAPFLFKICQSARVQRMAQL